MINFLQENNLDEHVDSFIAHGFDIETVRYITKDVLVDLEITQIGIFFFLIEKPKHFELIDSYTIKNFGMH